MVYVADAITLCVRLRARPLACVFLRACAFVRLCPIAHVSTRTLARLCKRLRARACARVCVLVRGFPLQFVLEDAALLWHLCSSVDELTQRTPNVESGEGRPFRRF